MGLAQDDFLDLTPRQLDEIVRAWRLAKREQFAMLAALRADVINSGFFRPKEPVKPIDLMPREDLPAIEKPCRRRMTARLRREIASATRRMFMAMSEEG